MTSTIVKQYSRLLTLWPKDALRPNVLFTRAIEHRGLPHGLRPSDPPSTAAQSSSSPSPFAATTTSSPPNTQFELTQVNALFSLLENRYSRKYPLSPAVLKPTSAPEHYKRLMAEIERAPSKTWWQAKLEEWKMKIRWS